MSELTRRKFLALAGGAGAAGAAGYRVTGGFTAARRSRAWSPWTTRLRPIPPGTGNGRIATSIGTIARLHGSARPMTRTCAVCVRSYVTE